jgi:hypothetical protein
MDLERLKEIRRSVQGQLIAIPLPDFDLLVAVYGVATRLPKDGIVSDYWRWNDELRAALKAG